MNVTPAVLIVDDDVAFGQTLSDVLQAKGHQVAVATGGREALGQVKERPFTFILLDVRMPDMNGVETYKEIKKVRPGTPVVMMTAYAVLDLVQEALAEGAHSVMYKPLEIDELLGLINKAAQGGLA